MSYENISIKLIPNPSESLQLKIEELYIESFPISERIDFSSLIQSIKDGKRQLYVVKCSEDFVGFAIINLLSEVKIILLEYIAITPENRNKGVGSLLLHYLEETKSKDGLGIILEVESPFDCPPEELQLRQRRIEFYHRNGYRVVDCVSAYCMPDISGYGTVPLLLMWRPFQKENAILKGEQLKGIITSIFRISYEREKGDEILKGILDSLIC